MTLKPILERERAVEDVEAASDHYLAQGGSSLAMEFLDAVEQAYSHIAEYPRAAVLREDLSLADLRSRSLRRFPYLVFYVERETRIDVWRVLYAGRDLTAHVSDPDEV
jgi:toxin ParE1/3/4